MLLLAGLTPTVRAQTSLTLAWDPDPSSGVAGYRLYEGGASRTYTNVIATGSATTATVSNLISGATYFFAVTAIGTNGVESDFSSEISYTVPLPTNIPPVIALIILANGAPHTAPATLNLIARVTANGHTISQVQFYNGATLLGSATSAPYIFSWRNVSAGTYSLTAKVIYDSGSTVVSAIASVIVVATAPNLKMSVVTTTSTNQSGIGLSRQSSILLSATGQPGQTYYVMCSQDLVTWTLIGTLTLDATGSGDFTDPAGISRPRSFYRLQSISLTPPNLRISAAAGGSIVLSGTGPAGGAFNVQCTEDCKAWTVIGSVTLDLSGSFTFTDPVGNSRPMRMYRLQSQ